MQKTCLYLSDTLINALGFFEMQTVILRQSSITNVAYFNYFFVTLCAERKMQLMGIYNIYLSSYLLHVQITNSYLIILVI